MISLIGHRIGKGVIGTNEENIRKVRSAPRPTTKKELRAFIGLAVFIESSFPTFIAVAVPMTDLPKKAGS